MTRKSTSSTRPSAPERALHEVDALLGESRFDDARARAEQALREHEGSAELHASLAKALFFSGQSSRALQEADRACALAPRDASIAARAGAMYAAIGQLERAIERCRAALQLDPNEATARVNLAHALSQSHQPAAAIDALAPLGATSALTTHARERALALLDELSHDPRAKSLREAIQQRAPDERDARATPAGAVLATAHKRAAPIDSTAEKLGRDLVALARRGLLDRPSGREAEIDQLIDVLCRRRKSNPCLVGPAGVGKTAIVEALAHRVADGDVPLALKGARIIELSMASLTAGTSLRGELEDRLQRLLDELREHRSTVLFLDEVHTLVSSSGGAGQLAVAEVLKPAMARGELSLIGATTDEGYERSIQRDPALARRFERVEVAEPDERALAEILRGAAADFARHHGVRIDSHAIDATRTLCARWLGDRRMPDVGVDVLDRAAVRAARERAGSVSAAHIERTVAALAQCSIEQLRANPVELRARVLDHLERAVIGHRAALASLADSYAMSAVREARDKRPRAVLWLHGATSIGKHAALTALAAATERPIVRFDLRAIAERHDLSKLVGTSAGFVGYDDGAPLVRALRAQPSALLCFDQPEQAHPDARALLASAIRDGALVDARGDSADLRRACVVFLSQRTDTERAAVGFSLSTVRAETAAANATLGDALAGTLDATIAFAPLDSAQRAALVERFIGEAAAALDAHEIKLSVDPAAVRWLSQRAANARELRARCEREVLSPSLALGVRAITVRLEDEQLRCEPSR